MAVNLQHASRSGDVTCTGPSPVPQPKPDSPFPVPWPNGPCYSPRDLMNETYFALWQAGKIPPGPMRDPAAAEKASRDLLRAFGVTPVESDDLLAETRRAAQAVQLVCGVPA